MNLKSKELASSLGVDESTVSRWENGRKRIGEWSDRLLRTLYLSCTEEEQDRRNILEVLKSFPHHRKEIRERQAISLNPQDWLLPDCACAV